MWKLFRGDERTKRGAARASLDLVRSEQAFASGRGSMVEADGPFGSPRVPKNVRYSDRPAIGYNGTEGDGTCLLDQGTCGRL